LLDNRLKRRRRGVRGNPRHRTANGKDYS